MTDRVRGRRTGILVVLLVVAGLAAPRDAAGASGFHAAWLDQSPWPTLRPGGSAPYTIRYRNIGEETWQRGVAGRQVNLGIAGDSNAFAAAGMAVGWLASNRPATTTEATVPPGGIATFTFTLGAPLAPGVFSVPLRPVLDGVTWLEDEGAYVQFTSDFGFHARWLSQSAYPTLSPGATSDPLMLTFRNSGDRPWLKGTAGQQANLGVNGDDRTLAGLAVSWPTPDRVASQSESTVAPGATATFTFRVKAPTAPGTYALHLRLVVDGTVWLEDEGVFLVVTVIGGAAPNLTTTTVQSGLQFPWDIAFAPDGRMFVTERVGNVLVYASGAPNAPQLANNGIPGIHASGEAGAMGIALDPDFANNHFVYVCVSRDDNGWLNQVLRYRESGSQLTFDGYVIRSGMYAGGNHDGCRIRFGPDGKLWVTMGEVGNTAFSQNPNSLNGKVLRVNPDGTIPEDNPILSGAFARSAAYTMGHRNPQGICFQPGTGQPFTSEHAHYTDRATGTHSHATVNLLRGGANFSWPLGAGPGFIPPAWQSNDDPYVATSGCSFVGGSAWGGWSGNLFVATLAGTRLLRLAPGPGNTFTTAQSLYVDTFGRIRAATQAADGSLYISTDNGSDRIVRITPSQP